MGCNKNPWETANNKIWMSKKSKLDAPRKLKCSTARELMVTSEELGSSVWTVIFQNPVRISFCKFFGQNQFLPILWCLRFDWIRVFSSLWKCFVLSDIILFNEFIKYFKMINDKSQIWFKIIGFWSSLNYKITVVSLWPIVFWWKCVNMREKRYFIKRPKMITSVKFRTFSSSSRKFEKPNCSLRVQSKTCQKLLFY